MRSDELGDPEKSEPCQAKSLQTIVIGLTFHAPRTWHQSRPLEANRRSLGELRASPPREIKNRLRDHRVPGYGGRMIEILDSPEWRQRVAPIPVERYHRMIDAGVFDDWKWNC